MKPSIHLHSLWSKVSADLRRTPAWRRFRIGLVVLTLAVATGCSSGLTTISRSAPVEYESLGIAQATACGSELFGGVLTNFIPAGMNSRLDRAYTKALRSKPGATKLRSVSISEHWFFWLLGSTRCVTITGEALR